MKNKVLIIAEAGVNHNGDIRLAKKLVDIAVEAGADIVKFQTFIVENLVTQNAKMADYQIENTKNQETQFQMLKKLELTKENFVELYKYCEQKKIRFLSTGFDIESLNFLKPLNHGLWKIPSGEITNKPYLQFVGSLKEKVILSTGMADMQEIKDAIGVLLEAGTTLENITVLHCNTEYPTPFKDVHLNAMNTIKKELKTNIGYSDHTAGIEISVAAVALGATVIEKHFTVDKTLPGPDHAASLSSHELKSLVSSIRHVEEALGRSEKFPSDSEAKNKVIARKSLIAKNLIKQGEVFTSENLTIKRPGSGISPMRIDEVIGKKAKRDFSADELIEI